MSRTKRIILFASVALVFCVVGVATLVKDTENGLSDKGFPDDGATINPEESKKKGVFVTDVKLVPTSQTIDGIAIIFSSAWIERKIKTKPYFVWWKQMENQPGYYLVVRCEPHNVLEDHKMWLVREDQGHSLGMHGTDSFDESLESSEFSAGSTKLFLVTDWHAPRTNPIDASWTH